MSTHSAIGRGQGMTLRASLPIEASVGALVAGVIGLVSMAAVVLGAPTITSIATSRVPVAANTGLGLVLLAIALVGAHQPAPVLRRLAAIPAGLTLLLGMATLAQFFTGRDLGVDGWLFPSPPGASEMSPQTAVAFVLLSSALLAAHGRFGLAMGRVSAAVVIALAFVNVLDFLFGASSPTVLGSFTQMALPTAISLLGIGVGVGALHPEGTLLQLLRQEGSAGTLTRRLMLAALVIPIAVGWLRLMGERAGWYDTGYGVALTTAATVGLFAIAIRATGRTIQRAEEEARQAQQALDAARLAVTDLWDNAPIGYHSLDAQGRFVHVNRTELDMLGYERDEIIGRTFADLLVPGSLERFRETFPRFKAEGSIRDVEFEMTRKDGTLLPVRISATAVYDEDGAFVASRSAVRDIREQRMAEADRERAREEAVAASEAKSQFLSRMSHELRTPLNSVLGFAQLLEADGLASEHRESVSYIRRAGQHLLDLINEVLDIARIEQGRLTISVEPVALRETLQEVSSFVQPLAAARTITLDISEASRCSPYVLADRQRLRQVLLNLLTNAVKYNREGGSIRVACARADGRRVRIDVVDTGPGITRLHQARLFQPFERLGAEASGVEGAGMGLALSKALMTAMGGEIGAESESGQGSTFWITLPTAEAPLDAVLDALPAPIGVDGAAAITLLYIEDNPANLRLVEKITAAMPRVRLMTAIQGRMGIELARQHRPSVVLLDLHLPDMNGRDVLRELRSRPATASIPVVILSADASDGQRRTLLADGADGYLTKPLVVAELIDTIERLGVAEKREAATRDA